MLTCSVSSQHNLGLRQVAKKSCAARVSRNSAKDQHEHYGVRAGPPLLCPSVHPHPLTRQVAPSLPHAPHWGVLCLLPTCCSQERVILQPGETLGAVNERADVGCHLRGVEVLCQILTFWLVTTRKGLCPAVTNDPNHGPEPSPPRGPPQGEAIPSPGAQEIKLSWPAVAPAWRDLGPALPPMSPAPICAMQPMVTTTCPQPSPAVPPLRGCWSPACRRDGTSGNTGGGQHHPAVTSQGHRDKVPKTSSAGPVTSVTAGPVALLTHPSVGSVFSVPHQRPSAAAAIFPVPQQCPQYRTPMPQHPYPQCHTSVPSTGPQCHSTHIPQRPQYRTRMPQHPYPQCTPLSPVQDSNARAPSPGPHQCPRAGLTACPPSPH